MPVQQQQQQAQPAVANCDRLIACFAQTIEQWSKDAMLISLIGSIGNELTTDRTVLSHLVSCGSIRLEQTALELRESLAAAKRESGKASSPLIIADQLQQADLCWARERYDTAIAYLTRAIRLHPMVDEDENRRSLARLYMRRARVTMAAIDAMRLRRLRIEKYDDDDDAQYDGAQVEIGNATQTIAAYELAAVRDIELAMMANRDVTLELLAPPDFEMMREQAESRRQSPYGINDGAQSNIIYHRDVQWNYYVDDRVDSFASARNPMISLSATESIDRGSPILTEMPFAQFEPIVLDRCRNCRRRLIDARFWPCQSCVDALYCSRRCEEANYPIHKYECGLLRYLQKSPLRSMMLRMYFSANASPITACSAKIDFVRQYLKAVNGNEIGSQLSPDNEDNDNDRVEQDGDEVYQQDEQNENENDDRHQRNSITISRYALNAFRQTIDRRRRKRQQQQQQQQQKQSSNDRHYRRYFATMLRAIELYLLYGECVENAAMLDAKRRSETVPNRNEKTKSNNEKEEEGNEVDEQVDERIGSNVGGGEEIGSMNSSTSDKQQQQSTWHPDISDLEAIAFTFRDLKRFTASPLLNLPMIGKDHHRGYKTSSSGNIGCRLYLFAEIAFADDGFLIAERSSCSTKQDVDDGDVNRSNIAAKFVIEDDRDDDQEDHDVRASIGLRMIASNDITAGERLSASRQPKWNDLWRHRAAAAGTE